MYTGYKIPFKDYEIKTAKELDLQFKNDLTDEEYEKWEFEVSFHNLKEDDNVVIKKSGGKKWKKKLK